MLHANREQSRGHIEMLKKAFEEVGNLTRVQPLLVNDNMEIIDGQHRFTACKELGLPIYYTVVPGLGVQEARSMNIHHRNWRTEDYAKSYADSGDSNYKKYLELKDEYGFSNSVMFAAFNEGNDKGVFKDFRKGEFTVGDLEKVMTRLDYFAEVSSILDFHFDRYLARALVRLLNNENFDRDRMLNKIAAVGTLQRDVGPEGYLRQLEEIYNHKVHEGNRVRLF
jgi:hypothetical protein